jgi:mRNA interferase MazF
MVNPAGEADDYVPQRGDIIWLTLSPQLGHEQAGRRPALVLSDAQYNAKVGLAVVCPVTRQVKGYPFEVPLPAGCAIEGVVLADQVRSVDWRGGSGAFADTPGAHVADTVVETLSRVIGPLPSGETQ